MSFDWSNVQEELEIGFDQEAEIQNDEYEKISIIAADLVQGLYEVTLHAKGSGDDQVHTDLEFDKVVTLCEKYGLTPNDFLTEEEE